MPTYEFQCSKCNEVFTLIISISEYEAGNFKCPKCQSSDVKQQLTTFTPKTSRKS